MAEKCISCNNMASYIYHFQVKNLNWKHASLQYTKRKACLVAHCKSRVYIILEYRVYNFAQGDVRINFGRKIKRKPFKFFVENVVKGNSEQIALNFPAKSLSIYLKKL